MAMTAIELSNIVKTFRIKAGLWRKQPFNAVDNVDLRIDAGEVFGLLGRNGAGKTTLIKVMAGLLAADAGTGTVLGYDIHRNHKQIRASVSLVAPTADVGTDNNLTVRQNLEFWAVVYNLPEGIRAARIDELLAFLDLKAYENFWPMSISAGMRQRLAIARSLLVKNPILFLDEPTVKLDATGAQAVRDFIRKINHEFEITVILTTHFIFEAEELCDRVAIMDHGKIISCDSVSQLRKNLQQYDSCIIACDPLPDGVLQQLQAHEEVVTCTYSDGKLEISAENLGHVLFATLKLLREHHLDIYAVETNEPTLEDVFVHTVA
ncbi:MAG: ABC transporter ATP-binding protein [Anaerolineae bacterium]|nr:ABC transporter ATP-binding protein [Anaerolineae bacterium]